MRNVIILGLAAVSISACATTQREEVRADQSNIEKQERQLAAAKRDGTINEVKEERKDLREERKDALEREMGRILRGARSKGLGAVADHYGIAIVGRHRALGDAEVSPVGPLAALPVGTLKASDTDGGRVIHEAETEYQYARVVEYSGGARTLELNW